MIFKKLKKEPKKKKKKKKRVKFKMAKEGRSLFANLPEGAFPEEIIETISQGSSASSSPCRIERIVSRGHSSPADFWYDQEQTEFVCVLQGGATLEFLSEDGQVSVVEMEKGSYLTIAPHHKHRVASTSEAQPCVWLAVFF